MCEQENNLIKETVTTEETLQEQPPISPEISIKRFDITLRDTIYVVALFLSSIFISAFGVFGGFHGGFTVTAIILIVTMSLFLLGKGYKFKIFPALCLLLSIGTTLSFTLTSNGSVRFWSFVLFYLLSITWFTSTVRQQETKGDIGFFLHFFSPIIESLANLPTMFVSLFAKKKDENKTAIRIFLGILISLPVLLVVVPLLMNSDLAFSGMVSIIFKQTATIILRCILGTIIAIFVISYALSLKKGQPLITKGIEFTGIEPTIIITFLSVLSVCYLSYLFSQFAYFFKAFSGFLPEGYKFTYAEYARRGFFEMSAIAAINFIVIFLCKFLVNKQNKKAVVAVNGVSTFIGTFTLLIIATALSKMALYIKSYGMTKLRITTSTFMIFLAIVFISLMLRLYTKKVNVLKTAFTTAAIALILLGTLNVNSIVAQYNYTAYKNGILKEIDVNTISELGDEGIPYLVKLANEDISEASNSAAYKLVSAYEDYFEIKYDEYNNRYLGKKLYTEIGELSLPRQRAYKELETYIKNNPYILENEFPPNIYDTDEDYYEDSELY